MKKKLPNCIGLREQQFSVVLGGGGGGGIRRLMNSEEIQKPKRVISFIILNVSMGLYSKLFSPDLKYTIYSAELNGILIK